MDSPISPPLSVAAMVEICRQVSEWITLFRYDFRRSRWTFHPPGGGMHPVSETYMPQIAAELGGWPESRGVAA